MTARPKANWGVQIPSQLLDEREAPKSVNRRTVGQLQVGEFALVIKNGVVVDPDLRAYISQTTTIIDHELQDTLEVLWTVWVKVERLEDGLRLFTKTGQKWKPRELIFREGYLPVIEIVSVDSRAES